MPLRSLILVMCLGSVFAAAPTTPTAPSFPELTYSTYLRDAFTPNAIATDSSGSVYLAGSAVVDPSTSQTTALVVKINPKTNEYLYLRYWGGSVYDSASAIAVDSAGNTYVAGATASPDFPVTTGGSLGTAPTSVMDRRSFLVKFDPNGELVFSDLLGGSTFSVAQAVAVNADGQILVSGTTNSPGFPTTPGAYSIANTANHPYLQELDPTGTKLIFSATGIGGSALALDAAGNIYTAGTTYLLDYPTTPGAYQTSFPVISMCFPPCSGGLTFQGANQYLTKIDPTGSKLIFSTSVSGNDNTTNGGLAVDAAGDVYLTGLAAGTYPYTIPVPAAPMPSEPGVSGALPFLTKLDPAGQNLLWSVPAGGAGVQLDSGGNVYVGGMVGTAPGPGFGFDVAASIPPLANIPNLCLPNAVIARSSYISQLDAASGNVRGTYFIGGSTLLLSGAALAGSSLWITGQTNLPDFPISPNALTVPIGPGGTAGAYLGAVDFSQTQPPAGTPHISCIVDAADFALAGPVAPLQLLTIFGTGLGPATGVIATNFTTDELAGVEVSFGSTPAPLLYVSSTQINFAVPADTSADVMDAKVTVNGVSSPARQFALTFDAPSLFPATPPPASNPSSFPLPALALNSDGSVNSSSNPAPLGSVITIFLNGISPDPDTNTAPLQLTSDLAWMVTDVALENPFVTQVSLQVPSKLVNNFACLPPNLTECQSQFDIFNAGVQLVSGTAYVSGQQ
jgi:uncharacterized protein (TIGR03437 family)